MHNRPVLATPVGGLCEMVVPDRTGWLTRDTSVPALSEGIEHLADNRDEVDAVIRSGAAREHVAARFERRACFQPVIDALRGAGLVGIGGGQALDESRGRRLRRAA
jgi:glycosyltransferase involved in cell wall biosynthesis